METSALKRIQQRLSYQFRRISLLQMALTHPSYSHEHPEAPHNQRLEFLGDAVLDFLVAAWLYRRHPESQEGYLTQLRAKLVCTETLAKFARSLGLGEALRLGKGEQASGGARRDANLCDAFEATVGALYLDSNLETVWQHLEAWFAAEAEEIINRASYVDAKTRLQEWAQAHKGITPQYRIVGEHGPDHAKVFTAQVLLNDKVWGEGQGSSKRSAERAAAAQAVSALGLEETREH